MNYLGLVGLLGLTGERRRAAGAGGGPDRRHRRRRADGGVRDPRRAARARRAPARASSSTSRWPTARCPGWRWSPRATSPTASSPQRGGLELAGSLVCYRPVPVRRRLGHARRAGAEVLAGVVPRRRPRGPDREAVRARPARRRTREVAGDLHGAHARASGQAFASEHDCCLEPVLDLDEALDSELVRAREMVVELDQPGATEPVRLLGVPVKLSAHAGRHGARPGPGARRAHRRGARAPPATAPSEIAALEEAGAVAGPAGEGARGSFLS